MKKEAYFTAATIQRQSDELLRNVMALRKQRDWAFDPGRAALLVLDMQECFLDPGSHSYVPSGRAIIPGIEMLIRVFAGSSRPIIFTRHLNTAEDAGLMAKWWKDLIEETSPRSGLISELDASAGRVFRKHRYDAFSGTDLEDTLKSRSVKQVVICGLMTHLCCETTARSAFMRGFEVFFTVDGTATYAEAFHAATLLNLSHGFATPVLAAEIQNAFEGSHDRP